MKIFLNCIVISLILASCQKKDETPVYSCSNSGFSASLIDSHLTGFFFKPGSYWVYQDVLSNNTDSVVLNTINTGCEPVADPMHSGSNFEYYTMNYTSYPAKTHFYNMIEGTSMSRNCHPANYNTWNTGFHLFSVKPDSAYIDTLQVGNHKFTLVYAETRDPYDSIYTSMNTGIVRRVMTGVIPAQEWNLVRWKIIR